VNRLTIAVEALRACAEVGLNVADDIAVVGCDDRMFVSLLSPALTTLRSAPQTQDTESAVLNREVGIMN
jgi:DNA-binding LacI/PurR family transcriptional regulator